LAIEKDDENIIINNRRKKDLGILGTSNSLGNLGMKEDGKNKQIFQEMINESEFENCNVNLKTNNTKTNRPNSRKRSAFKYIEDNLEKEKIPESWNKDYKDIRINQKLNKNNINPNQANEINQTNQGFLKDNKNIKKPKIIGERESNMNKFLQNVNGIDSNNHNNNNNTEKKIEYESRRKKPMSFINGIDNFSGGKEKDNKNNINNNNGSSKNLLKPEMNVTSGYESRRQINFNKNISSKDKDTENNFGSNKNLFKI